MSLPKAIQFRYLIAQLSDSERTQFLSQLLDSDSDLIVSALFQHLSREPQHLIVNTVNHTLRDIIQSREPQQQTHEIQGNASSECKAPPNTVAPSIAAPAQTFALTLAPAPTPTPEIQQKNELILPSVILNVIASWLCFADQITFSMTSRVVYIATHAPLAIHSFKTEKWIMTVLNQQTVSPQMSRVLRAVKNDICVHCDEYDADEDDTPYVKEMLLSLGECMKQNTMTKVTLYIPLSRCQQMLGYIGENVQDLRLYIVEDIGENVEDIGENVANILETMCIKNVSLFAWNQPRTAYIYETYTALLTPSLLRRQQNLELYYYESVLELILSRNETRNENITIQFMADDIRSYRGDIQSFPTYIHGLYKSNKFHRLMMRLSEQYNKVVLKFEAGTVALGKQCKFPGCGKRFDTRNELLNHVAEAAHVEEGSGGTVRICADCGAQCNTKQLHSKHLQVHQIQKGVHK
eukprot:248448_1